MAEIVKVEAAPEVATACTAFDAKLVAIGGATGFGRRRGRRRRFRGGGGRSGRANVRMA